MGAEFKPAGAIPLVWVVGHSECWGDVRCLVGKAHRFGVGTAMTLECHASIQAGGAKAKPWNNAYPQAIEEQQAPQDRCVRRAATEAGGCVDCAPCGVEGCERGRRSQDGECSSEGAEWQQAPARMRRQSR